MPPHHYRRHFLFHFQAKGGRKESFPELAVKKIISHAADKINSHSLRGGIPEINRIQVIEKKPVDR